jgi:hypothetical protein
MKLTQTLLLTLLITFTAFSAVTYTACKKDPCKDISCLNGGSCNDGVCKCKANYAGPRCEKDLCAKVNCLNDGVCVSGLCQCPPGFDGDSCQVRLADKFSAEWAGTSQCAPHQYDINYVYIKGVTATTISAHLPDVKTAITGSLTSPTTASLSKAVLSTTMTLDSANLTYTPHNEQLLVDYFITVSSDTSSYQLSCAATYKALPKRHPGSSTPSSSR